MENKIYKLAVIGCGSRARGVISHLIDDDPNRKIEVVSIYDPDPVVMKTPQINGTVQLPNIAAAIKKQ